MLPNFWLPCLYASQNMSARIAGRSARARGGYVFTAALAAATAAASWSVPCFRRAMDAATAFASVKRQAESALLDAT